MAEVILMPRLSDTMTEGVIAAWHKKRGPKTPSVKKILPDENEDKQELQA